MIRLKTLGAPDLSAADGAALQPVLRQTKRFALLAYLAIERGGQFHRRDHLLGLFWPDTDLRSGRNALSQAMHFLRQYLGKAALTSRGDEEIGLAPDAVWCDAAEFQEHMAAGRFAEAMDLYAGPLLPAFFVGEADGFEQWLEQKRSSLQREAVRACSALADAADQEGRHDDVVQWLRRAISYQPLEESLHRRLIVAYDRAGDRASALEVYDALKHALHVEFGAEPSAETNDVVQAVRARSESRGAPELADAGYPSRARVTAGGRPRRRHLWAAAAVIVFAVAAALWIAFTASDETRADPPVNRIAVLFFNDGTPNHELSYVADGLTTTLIDHLGGVRQVEVISQNGVRPFRGDSIPLDSIARQLDVGTIVGGAIARSGDQLRVTVEIVKGPTGIVARSKTFQRPTGELFSLLDDISNEVGSFLRETLGEEVKLQRYQHETESVAAWQAVQKAEQRLADARSANDRGDAGTARTLLDQADTLLRRAAGIDRRWPTPLVVRAYVNEMRAWLSMGRPPTLEGYLDEAMVAAESALERGQDHAPALEARGRIRFVRYMLTPTAPAQAASLLANAERDLTRSLQLDANRARAESTLSMLYEFQGRFADAQQAARRALEADAYLEDADQIALRLFQSSFELGDDVEAGHWCDEVRSRMSGKWPAAYCDLMLLAWRTDSDVDGRKALFTLETFGGNDDPEVRATMRPRLTMLAAAAVARSGDVARAERMVREAHAAAPHDGELLYFEAGLRIHLREYQEAKRLVAEYIGRYPRSRARIENGRFFQPLRASLGTPAAAKGL